MTELAKVFVAPRQVFSLSHISVEYSRLDLLVQPLGVGTRDSLDEELH
jgi:hypothetical protein